MQNLAFLSQVALLILLAPIFSRILKIPVAVVEILLGVIAVWIGYLHADNDVFQTIAKIGFFYLMFLAGLEINVKQFKGLDSKFIKNTIIYFISLYGISFGLYLIFDLSPIYIVAIPIVSLGMIVILTNEYNKEEHQWLQWLFIIGAIGELISIASLVILDSAMLHGFDVEFYKNIFILMFIFVVAFYLFRFFGFVLWWFPELRRIIMPENDRMSQDIRVSIALFFVLIGVMQYHGIDMVLGAFISGVFIANFFKHKETLPETLNKVGFGFLVPLFFIYVGTTLDLEVVMKLEIIFQSLWIVVAMVGVRIISAFIAYYKFLGTKDTMLFAFGYSMPLTFLVAIATIAIQTDAISLHDYYAFVLAAMIEAVFIMIIIQFIMPRATHKG